MTFNYARAAATAQRLIANFGQAAVLEKQTVSGGPEYDPTFTATQYGITAVDLDITRAQAGVTMTKRTLYISTGGQAPAKGDRVQIGAEWARIEEVRTLSPAGVNVLYEADLEA